MMMMMILQNLQTISIMKANIQKRKESACKREREKQKLSLSFSFFISIFCLAHCKIYLQDKFRVDCVFREKKKKKREQGVQESKSERNTNKPQLKFMVFYLFVLEIGKRDRDGKAA